MKELKSIKIIAVDHGYGNIKTANTVTPTGITAYDTEPIFSGNILEYNGTYYRIGEGHKEFIPDKAMDEDYYLLTLMAVARELNAYGIREAPAQPSDGPCQDAFCDPLPRTQRDGADVPACEELPCERQGGG